MLTFTLSLHGSPLPARTVATEFENSLRHYFETTPATLPEAFGTMFTWWEISINNPVPGSYPTPLACSIVQDGVDAGTVPLPPHLCGKLLQQSRGNDSRLPGMVAELIESWIECTMSTYGGGNAPHPPRFWRQ